MDTLERITQLACKEFSLEADQFDAATPLDSLGIDSLSLVDFMYKVEEEFGISVADEHLKRVKTLRDLERHVAAAMAAGGRAA
jgi:acyl carrier protein